MCWHAERKKQEDDADDDEADKILRQPSDASQWKVLDIEYPKFGDDPRNVTLGVRCDDELAYLVDVGDLDYECDRFISKQCDSYSMPVLCYFYCIILYTCYILYTILYYV
jgi:hypothetical protein